MADPLLDDAPQRAQRLGRGDLDTARADGRRGQGGETAARQARVVGNRGGTWADSRETTEAQVLEIVQTLTDAGVDINAKASNGRTAVEGANEADFRTVVDYLVSKGIDKSRIEAIGYGDERPLASNDTEVGRQTNRRIEATEL